MGERARGELERGREEGERGKKEEGEKERAVLVAKACQVAKSSCLSHCQLLYVKLCDCVCLCICV